jgi:hypothetical protein
MALATAFTTRLNGGEGAHQNVFVDSITFPGDSAYATGGTAAFSEYFRSKGEPYGARRVINVEGWAIISAVLHVLKYDRVNDKLLVFKADDGTQVANATDLDASTFNATVWSE